MYLYFMREGALLWYDEPTVSGADDWYEVMDVRSWGADQSWDVNEIAIQITGAISCATYLYFVLQSPVSCAVCEQDKNNLMK
jgi:hypothetical protein